MQKQPLSLSAIPNAFIDYLNVQLSNWSFMMPLISFCLSDIHFEAWIDVLDWFLLYRWNSPASWEYQ